MHDSLHTPVLHEEIKKFFLSKSFQKPVVVDATLGLGGHAEMLLSHMDWGIFFGFDRDRDNLDRARNFLEKKGTHVEKFFVTKSFSSLSEVLHHHAIYHIDAILYDLWVSSLHYDDPSRGFSLRADGPLDMRFDRTRGRTAEDMIHTQDVWELARIFSLYGEEKKSWFIANAIVAERKKTRICSTMQLLRIIESSSFDKKSPIRVFQALRIAVNEEFSHIEHSLAQALENLAPGWICMVITFHSLEDRLVKHFFAPYLEDTVDEVTGQIRSRAKYRKLTKKPLEPSLEELHKNPRSRSAKLRIIERHG